MEATILVTGGAGYIGSHVCKALARAGYLPVTVDNLMTGHARLVRWGPLEVVDLRNGVRLAEVLKAYKPVAVMHLAALSSVTESVAEPALYHDNNVTASQMLLATMAAADVRSIVFSSSCSVYDPAAPQPLSEDAPLAAPTPYGATKLAVERMLMDASDVAAVSLRFFNAAGADPDGETGECHDPETHLIPTLLQVAAGLRPLATVHGTDFPTPDGTGIRDFVHVCDIATAHLAALQYLIEGGTTRPINLGSGCGSSVRKVVTTVRQITERPVRVIEGARRPGDPPVLVGNAAVARRILRWEPRFPQLADQVRHAWHWHSASS